MAGRSKRGQPNRNRRLLRDAHERAMEAAPLAPHVDPVEALLEVLSRATARYRVCVAEVDKLEYGIGDGRQWRETPNQGLTPNEWIRLENDLREDIMHLAGRMVALGILDRHTPARQLVADALAPALIEMFAELSLTPEQRVLLPDVVRRALLPLEAGGDAA